MTRRTAATRDGQPEARAPDAPAIHDHVDRAIVAVQREWTDWRSVHVRVADLEDVHWALPPGARQPLVHGSVWCDRLQSGRLIHECGLTPAPHRLLVCVLKSHTQPAVFAELSRRADEAARRASRPRL